MMILEMISSFADGFGRCARHEGWLSVHQSGETLTKMASEYVCESLAKPR